MNYTYDGDGNRVEKSGKLYWYGAGTEILDKSDGSGNFTNEYVFFGGKRVAMRTVSSGTIDYYEDDMLGSARTMVQAGATSVCFDADFLPFGQEVDFASTCGSNYKFEGKERDLETGNDDFGARYYRSALGRWLSADWSAVPAPVPYANLTNPQTLNLYAMVSDNPGTFNDLDGHECNKNSLPGDHNSCPGPAATKTAKPGDGFTNDGLQKSPTQQAQQPQQQNQPQQDNATNAAERATQAGEAALNFALAGTKIKAAAALSDTVETGVGALAVAYTAWSAAGNLAAGAIQSIGAATGQTKSFEAAAEIASVATSGSGLITFVATKGNLSKAATAAAVEGIVTSNPKDLVKGGTVERAAKAIDLMQNIHQIEQKVKSRF